MGDPKITFGSRRAPIILKGREAIRAAGWTLRFWIASKAIALLLSLPLVGFGVYTVIRWWFSYFPAQN